MHDLEVAPRESFDKVQGVAIEALCLDLSGHKVAFYKRAGLHWEVLTTVENFSSHALDPLPYAVSQFLPHVPDLRLLDGRIESHNPVVLEVLEDMERHTGIHLSLLEREHVPPVESLVGEGVDSGQRIAVSCDLVRYLSRTDSDGSIHKQAVMIVVVDLVSLDLEDEQTEEYSLDLACILGELIGPVVDSRLVFELVDMEDIRIEKNLWVLSEAELGSRFVTGVFGDAEVLNQIPTLTISTCYYPVLQMMSGLEDHDQSWEVERLRAEDLEAKEVGSCGCIDVDFEVMMVEEASVCFRIADWKLQGGLKTRVLCQHMDACVCSSSRTRSCSRRDQMIGTCTSLFQSTARLQTRGAVSRLSAQTKKKLDSPR
jgi:hypothetical protein